MVTERRKKVLEKIMENNGTGSVSQAMRDAGYSETYASNPHLFKKTKAWQDILDSAFPDNYLTKMHKELFKHSHIVQLPLPGSIPEKQMKKLIKKVAKGAEYYQTTFYKKTGKDEYTAIPQWMCIFVALDPRARANALDMAYKLKNKYKEEIIVKHSNLTPDDAEDAFKDNPILRYAKATENNKAGSDGNGGDGKTAGGDSSRGTDQKSS